MSGHGVATRKGPRQRAQEQTAQGKPRERGGARALALRSGGVVRVAGTAGAETLSIVAADGALRLEVRFGPDGPVLRFGGARVAIEAEGELALRCRRFEVSSESISLAASGRLEQRAGGDLDVRAGGDAVFSAEAVAVEGRSGEVALRANDDVALNGERVLLNCPSDEEIERSREAASSLKEMLERPFVLPGGPRRLAGSSARIPGGPSKGAA